MIMIDDENDIPRRISSADPGIMNSIKGSPIIEKMFAVTISFIRENFMQGDGRDTPLLYFSAVLGIDLRGKKLRPSYNYTPCLAGIIWIARLITLEYALPKVAYEYEHLPDRSYYPDHLARVQEIRRMYLVEGSGSPMSALIGLLVYGFAAAKWEGIFSPTEYVDKKNAQER